MLIMSTFLAFNKLQTLIPVKGRKFISHSDKLEDQERVVYYLDVADCESYRGGCETEDCMKKAGTGHREECPVPAFGVIERKLIIK